VKEKIRDFFEPPRRMLFKPKDWERLSEEQQQAWKGRHWDFVIALTSAVVSTAVLIAGMLRQ